MQYMRVGQKKVVHIVTKQDKELHKEFETRKTQSIANSDVAHVDLSTLRAAEGTQREELREITERSLGINR